MADERSAEEHNDLLRQRAEAILATKGEAAVDLAADQIREIVHELHTHQIELELQNEELRQAQQELAEIRDRMADLYDHAPVGYATISEQGLILDANLTLGDMLGVHRSKLPGKRVSVFVHPEDHSTYYEHVRIMKETRRRHTAEFRMRGGEDAPAFWVRVECAVDETEGEGVRFRTVFMDITERKNAVRAQLDLERQIMQAQKLESLGVLAGGIAHDFNNLLMVILGNVDLGLRAAAPEAPERGFFDEIRQAARRATELSNQMLVYAGKRRFVVERVDLNVLLDEMDHLLHASVSRKIALDVAPGDDLSPIDADAGQLRQVVLNLVANAAEAIGDAEGVITIATGSLHADRRILADAIGGEDLPEGDYVFLEVADDGCGIDGDKLDKLFDPFFSTKFLGRGLGLAAVRGIARSHRSAITVCSEAGKGSTFRLLLPARTEASERTTPANRQSQQQRRCVLVADDEDAVRKVVALMLQREGLRVLTAADGRQAVEVFRDHAGEIDAVLLDNRMPHLTGEEAFREIHRIRPDVPVILSSGFTQAEATHRFAGLDLAGFIQKPFDYKSLIAAFDNVLQPA